MKCEWNQSVNFRWNFHDCYYFQWSHISYITGTFKNWDNDCSMAEQQRGGMNKNIHINMSREVWVRNRPMQLEAISYRIICYYTITSSLLANVDIVVVVVIIYLFLLCNSHWYLWEKRKNDQGKSAVLQILKFIIYNMRLGSNCFIIFPWDISHHLNSISKEKKRRGPGKARNI